MICLVEYMLFKVIIKMISKRLLCGFSRQEALFLRPMHPWGRILCPVLVGHGKAVLQSEVGMGESKGPISTMS